MLLCLLIVASYLTGCESLQKEGIRSDLDNPAATETNENKHFQEESIIENEDPVYQETRGLYTEEDLENAKPLEMPVQHIESP